MGRARDKTISGNGLEQDACRSDDVLLELADFVHGYVDGILLGLVDHLGAVRRNVLR